MGHYTQLVNSNTARVGCAAAEILRNGKPVSLVGCNYASGQNFYQVPKPFTNGTSCSMCPGNCVNNLCECKKKERKCKKKEV